MVRKIRKKKRHYYTRGSEIIKMLDKLNERAPDLVEAWVNERFPIIIMKKQNKIEKLKNIFRKNKKKNKER